MPLFDWIDSLSTQQFVGIVVLLLAAVFGWLGNEMRKAPVDPDWAAAYDAEGRVVGVVRVGERRDPNAGERWDSWDDIESRKRTRAARRERQDRKDGAP